MFDERPEITRGGCSLKLKLQATASQQGEASISRQVDSCLLLSMAALRDHYKNDL